MAATHRLETTTSNSIDGSAFTGLSGHRSFSSTVEKSVSIRDGPSEGRVMVLGGGKPSVASQNGELQPTTQVLLDALSIDLKPHHLDLRRVINAATGALTDDPQSRPLKACGFEELKRLRQCLLENEKQARLRVKQLSDAMAKLNKVQNMLQSRKRSRPEPSTQERASLAVATGRMTTASHAKVSSSTVSNHVSTADISGASRAGDKNKSANPSKRIRTSMADVRPEGRLSNLSVQRPSSLQERERDMSRPSSSLALPEEEKERMPPGTNQGGEKVKLKGRRSSVKSEVSPAAVANGMSDGDRDHKWSAQHRLSLDSSRSRPSEGHGYRSGPVHGITSIHKAEVSAQANGLNMRGPNKGDSDGVISVGERGDRSAFSERERTTPKNEVRASPREEAHPASLPIVTKAKSARAPRSSSVSGTNPPGHLSRTSPLLEASDRPSVGTPPTKAQLLPGPSQRKRPAPSRSSSPPVAQWGSQRPQKPRQARRANLNPPVGILIPSRDDGNGAGESGTGRQEGSGSGSTPTGPRPTTPVAIGASSLERRVTVSSSQSLLQVKVRAEPHSVSVGLSESDDSDKDGEKAKDKNNKVVPELGETKMVISSQKTGSVFSSTNKSHVTLKEEGSQGDGVRRQGRTGRGSATPRAVTPVIAAPPETCDVVPANAKQLRSARGTPDVKPNRPGRPPLKKDAVDRKPATRRRESSGELDDDREELVCAIQSAVTFSVDASRVGFWKQVEPYFAYVTSADIDYLHQQTKELEVDDTALQIPSCGGQLLKFEMMRSSETPPMSPSPDMGANKSLGTVNGSSGSDGGSGARKPQGDETGCTTSGRGGCNGGFPDKFFSLSQRLMSAFITVEDTDEGDALRTSDETFRNESFREIQLQDSESVLHQGSQSGSERMDFDGGESDADFGRLDSECWAQGVRERGHSEVFAVSNGPAHNRTGLLPGKGDDPGEGDNILADPEGEYCADRANNELPSSKDYHQGTGKASELAAWEMQYHQMSLDDRLSLELQSIGLLPQQLPDLPLREDDEICEELRKLQCELKQQVCSNKEQISRLERAVRGAKDSEERGRECLAMDQLVERAYKRRMSSRGTKGAPVKGARTAAMGFAKRVISKVRSFEAGHSCIVDSTLRDLLFCISRKISEASIDKAQEVVSIDTPLLLSGDSPALIPAAGALRAGQEKVEKDSVEDKSSPGAHTKRITTKDEAWPIRAKKREVFLEDVSGRGINNCPGGTKGRRSDRERDGKGASGRDGNALHANESSRLGHVKGERKTKMKPRQKIRPLLKNVNVLAKSLTEQQGSKDRTSGQIPTPKLVSFGEESISMMPVPEELGLEINVDGIVDLSQLPLPGMDEMTVADMGPQVQDDMGSWFDFDDATQPTDELVMGLDVPMDDLSDLGMMM